MRRTVLLALVPLALTLLPVQSALAFKAFTLTKTADTTTVTAGGQVGYAITVRDSGTVRATKVRLTDTLPTTAGTNWSISPARSGCAVSIGVLTCVFGNLAGGEGASVHIVSPTTDASCGTINNSASATTANVGSAAVGPVPITVICPPSVAVLPTSGAPTTGLTVSGGGWPAGDSIAVEIGGSGVCNVTADASGRIAGDHAANGCRVPLAPAGSHPLTAHDLAVSGVSASGANFTVVPAVGLGGNQGSNSVAAGAIVETNGMGFGANSTIVSVSVDTTSATSNPATPFNTDSLGDFVTSDFGVVLVTIPAATTLGAHSLNATDAAGNTGSLNMMVFRPTVTLSSTSGAPGTGLTVTGGGWPAGDSVGVEVEGTGAGGTGSVCTLIADSGGNIAGDQATAGCQVPTVSGGSKVIRGFDGNVADVTTTGATFTVTPGLGLDGNQSSVSVAAGATVAISGAGFAANSTITSVAFDTTTVTSSPATPFSTDFDFGTFDNVLVTIPATTTAGTHTLSATDAFGHTGSLNVTVFSSTVVLSPASGPPGTALTVSGGGWPAGDLIEVDLIAAGDIVCALTAAADGSIAGDQATNGCRVPDLPGGGGSKRLLARDLNVLDVNTIGTPFTVTPEVFLDFGNSSNSVAAGARVVMHGHDFAANTTITSFTVNTTAATADPATPLASGNGDFGGVFVTIPAGTSAGTGTLTVTDASGDTGSLTLTVFRPTVVVSPTTGPSGTGLTVSGGGWPAGDPIEVEINFGAVCTLTADSGGNISGDQATNGCQVPLTSTGSRQLTAIDLNVGYVNTTGATFSVT